MLRLQKDIVFYNTVYLSSGLLHFKCTKPHEAGHYSIGRYRYR